MPTDNHKKPPASNSLGHFFNQDDALVIYIVAGYSGVADVLSLSITCQDARAALQKTNVRALEQDKLAEQNKAEQLRKEYRLSSKTPYIPLVLRFTVLALHTVSMAKSLYDMSKNNGSDAVALMAMYAMPLMVYVVHFRHNCYQAYGMLADRYKGTRLSNELSRTERRILQLEEALMRLQETDRIEITIDQVARTPGSAKKTV